MYGRVLDVGKGPAVVMAHGTMMDATMFEPQVVALRDRYRIIAYDQRARTSNYDTHYDLTDLAEDCRTLLDHLGIHQCVLVGMSMGGFMATEFIDKYPDRVTGLVLIGTQLGTYSPDEQERRMADFQKFDHEGKVGIELARETTSYIFSENTRRISPDIVSHWTTRWSELAAKSVLREAQSWLSERDYSEVARGFYKPVLAIHGEQDLVLPVDEKMNAMARAFPRIEIVRAPDSGHVVNLEAPELSNDIIRRFLDNVLHETI